MKLDILAIGVHPDDVELSAAGTILKHIALGKSVGVLDLTKGELGTRGSAELRTQEATNAISDRHPDHGRSAKLAVDACFYSGLIKIETILDGISQSAWRPKAVYHYIQDNFIEPDFVIDITAFMDKKTEAIMAYSSQFFNPLSVEPETPISSKNFTRNIKAKASIFGRAINCDYAEGFKVNRYIGVENLFDLK